MTKLAATLGISGTAAALLLVAFQMLPPRDGGSARAGTAPAIPVRAWADPPRAARDTAAVRPAATEIAPQPVSTAPEPVPPAPPAGRQAVRSEAAGRVRSDRTRHRVAQSRRARLASVAAPQRDSLSAPTPVEAAPVRMAGPIGDILHGFGLD